MNIEKLSECTNASKYGTCSECGVSESEILRNNIRTVGR